MYSRKIVARMSTGGVQAKQVITSVFETLKENGIITTYANERNPDFNGIWRMGSNTEKPSNLPQWVNEIYNNSTLVAGSGSKTEAYTEISWVEIGDFRFFMAGVTSGTYVGSSYNLIIGSSINPTGTNYANKSMFNVLHCSDRDISGLLKDVTIIDIITGENEVIISLSNPKLNTKCAFGYIPCIDISGKSNQLYLGVPIIKIRPVLPPGVVELRPSFISTNGSFKSFNNEYLGDVLMGKEYMHPIYIGFTGLGLIASLTDKVITLNRVLTNGDMVNINGINYVALSLGLVSEVHLIRL
ncbi:MAG: hypothetical protein ACRC68_00865 [Clostridium sp.]